MNESGNQTSIKSTDSSRQWVRRLSLVAKAMLLGLVLLLVASLFLEWLGAKAERNDVVALGQIGKAFLCLAILALNSIIPVGVKILSLGRYDMTSYFNKVRCILLYNIAIVLLYYFSPIPVTISTLKAITVISLAITLLCLTTTYYPQVVAVGSIMLVCLVYFPRVGQILENRVRQANQPKLLKIQPGHIATGKTRLFLDGKPIVYYLYHEDDNTYELFDSPGIHDIFPQQLQPVTEELVRKLVEDEELVSPRNIEGEKTSAAMKRDEAITEKRRRSGRTRESEESIDLPIIFAAGKKRVIADAERDIDENTELPTNEQRELNIMNTNNNRLSTEGKMLLTVDNQNCRQLNIYAEGRLIATVAANTRRLLHLKRGNFSTRECVWGEMSCGQKSHYHWTGDALTIPVSRNPSCDSQFGKSTYTDINM